MMSRFWFLSIFLFCFVFLAGQGKDTWGSLSTVEDNQRIIESFELSDFTLRNELAFEAGRREDPDLDSVLQWLLYRSFGHPEEHAEYTTALLLESRRKNHGSDEEKKAFGSKNGQAFRLYCTNFFRFTDSFLRAEILKSLQYPGDDSVSVLIGNCGALYLDNDSEMLKSFSDTELLAFIEASRLNPHPALAAAVVAIYQNSPGKIIHKKAYEVLLALTDGR